MCFCTEDEGFPIPIPSLTAGVVPLSDGRLDVLKRKISTVHDHDATTSKAFNWVRVKQQGSLKS